MVSLERGTNLEVFWPDKRGGSGLIREMVSQKGGKM